MRLRFLAVLVIVLTILGGSAPAHAETTAAGQLDKTFGKGGRVVTSVTPLGNADILEDVVVQADGRILATAAVVVSESSDADFGIVRYMPNGSLDPSFGNAGVVVTDFTGSDGVDLPSAIAVQPDGKIIVAGTALSFGRTSVTRFFALSRYLPDGRLDTSFARTGKVLTGFTSGAPFGSDVALEPDGKIVVFGSVSTCDADFNCTGQFALVRYTADGSLDKGFGSKGKVTTDFGLGGETFGAAMIIQPDGRIVAAGSTARMFALSRYQLDGALDPSFGTNGLVTTDFTPGGGSITAMERQSDGKIVVVGSQTDDSDNLISAASARYTLDGVLDSSFGTSGIVSVEIPDARLSATSVVIQSDGKIVIGGTWIGNPSFHRDTSPRFALIRYDTAGGLDLAFGDGGLVTTEFKDSTELRALAIQSDGRVIAGGCFDCASDFSDMALARYLMA